MSRRRSQRTRANLAAAQMFRSRCSRCHYGVLRWGTLVDAYAELGPPAVNEALSNSGLALTRNTLSEVTYDLLAVSEVRRLGTLRSG
jgi:hypothetical protein